MLSAFIQRNTVGICPSGHTYDQRPARFELSCFFSLQYSMILTQCEIWDKNRNFHLLTTKIVQSLEGEGKIPSCEVADWRRGSADTGGSIYASLISNQWPISLRCELKLKSFQNQEFTMHLPTTRKFLCLSQIPQYLCIAESGINIANSRHRYQSKSVKRS